IVADRRDAGERMVLARHRLAGTFLEVGREDVAGAVDAEHVVLVDVGVLVLTGTLGHERDERRDASGTSAVGYACALAVEPGLHREALGAEGAGRARARRAEGDVRIGATEVDGASDSDDRRGGGGRGKRGRAASAGDVRAETGTAAHVGSAGDSLVRARRVRRDRAGVVGLVTHVVAFGT